MKPFSRSTSMPCRQLMWMCRRFTKTSSSARNSSSLHRSDRINGVAGFYYLDANAFNPLLMCAGYYR
jgi:hypothetical protein